MKNRLKGKAGRLFVVCGLLLLMGITSVGVVQASEAFCAQGDWKCWLQYMREEEKLARDVYRQFCDLYGHRTFCNIMVSEQKHMDAMETLLIRYGVPDPVTNEDVPGGFTVDGLQTVYDWLIDRGDDSVLIEALKVGVDIEVMDIEDLEKAKASTKRRDIINVYNNLQDGSRNHLVAFCSVLDTLGVKYEGCE